ncbi:MAG: hypothetical protein COS34_13335 [Lysobacterales bacterium CG02_land_8_20_14_3_00_62_12]|nr:MAG: hypothetical protein COS34_13335 [Xanthomonadales bacterium CG02_land_8_20_14_3_00_62_12]
MAKAKRIKIAKADRRDDHDPANAAFCYWDGDTLVLNVLGKPSASKDVIGKAKGNQLKVSVTATPVAGRATDHMVRFLAAQFAVSAHDIEVVFGRFTVNKQLRIHAPNSLPPVIAEQLTQLL